MRSEKKKSEVKGFGNFDLLVPGTKRDAKKYEWLHRIAEVNELARAQSFSYGHFVAQGFMHFVTVGPAPKGYHTVREWRKIREQKSDETMDKGT